MPRCRVAEDVGKLDAGVLHVAIPGWLHLPIPDTSGRPGRVFSTLALRENKKISDDREDIDNTLTQLQSLFRTRILQYRIAVLSTMAARHREFSPIGESMAAHIFEARNPDPEIRANPTTYNKQHPTTS